MDIGHEGMGGRLRKVARLIRTSCAVA